MRVAEVGRSSIFCKKKFYPILATRKFQSKEPFKLVVTDGLFPYVQEVGPKEFPTTRHFINI